MVTVNTDLLNEHILSAIRINNSPPEVVPNTEIPSVWVLRLENDPLEENIFTEGTTYWKSPQKATAVRRRFVNSFIQLRWNFITRQNECYRIGQLDLLPDQIFQNHNAIDWAGRCALHTYFERKIQVLKISASQLPPGVYRG